MNFVVVDNNKSALDMLAKAIATAVPKCRVQPFTDSLLSAKYICNNPVDLVFVADAMHPVNGFLLLQVLRKNIPNIRKCFKRWHHVQTYFLVLVW